MNDRSEWRFQSVVATSNISNYKEEDVENKIQTEDLLHPSTEGIDVGSLAKRRVPSLDCPAL
jgi:hypothetical protein